MSYVSTEMYTRKCCCTVCATSGCNCQNASFSRLVHYMRHNYIVGTTACVIAAVLMFICVWVMRHSVVSVYTDCMHTEIR